MKVRIGTRRSALALWQARHISQLLRDREPGLEVELVEIVTKGDKILDAPLANVGGKGLFVKEIEDQLLEKKVDLAVHSLKDMPSVLPDGLVLACVPKREDPRDAFLSKRYASIEELPKGAKIGTSSLRRACQLKALRSDFEIVSIRGNVQTRIRKIEEELDAGVLANAGLRRLELAQHVRAVIAPEVMLPAVGQGALAIETRTDDPATLARVRALEDPEARMQVTAERAFLRRLGGSCQVPIAAHAWREGDRLRLKGLVGHPDGSSTVHFQDTIPWGSLEAADALGVRGAETVLAHGAATLLAAAGMAAPGAAH